MKKITTRLSQFCFGLLAFMMLSVAVSAQDAMIAKQRIPVEKSMETEQEVEEVILRYESVEAENAAKEAAKQVELENAQTPNMQVHELKKQEVRKPARLAPRQQPVSRKLNQNTGDE